MRASVRTILILAAVAGCFPASAVAGTAYVRHPGGDAGLSLTFGDQSGTGDGTEAQANHLVVSASPGSLIVRDDAAPLTAGPGCTGIDANTVSCPAAGVDTAYVDLGQGDDRLRDELPPFASSGIRNLQVFGGRGDDVILGGPGDNLVFGGPGTDHMSGGEGRDSANVQSSEPQRISLDGLANDGAAGEGDNVLPDFEYIAGGPGADTIIGNDEGNILHGGDGDDSITGAGGADSLYGEVGADSLDGGSGVDHVDANEVIGGAGTGDRAVVCGDGWDYSLGEGNDPFAPDCEQVYRDYRLHHNPPVPGSGTPPGLPVEIVGSARLTKRAVQVNAGCAATADCKGRISVYAGRKGRVAALRFSAHAGKLARLKLPLARRHRARLKRVRRVTVVAHGEGQKGGSATTRRKLRVRR